MLLSHIDTADWDEREWEYPPLSGYISGNRIYGNSRFLREHGIAAYGFFPVGLREDVLSIHSANEYIHEVSLWESFYACYRLLENTVKIIS